MFFRIFPGSWSPPPNCRQFVRCSAWARENFIGNIASSLAENNFDQALVWAQQLPNSRAKANAMSNLAGRWVESIRCGYNARETLNGFSKSVHEQRRPSIGFSRQHLLSNGPASYLKVRRNSFHWSRPPHWLRIA
jgi:hypothetical protein